MRRAQMLQLLVKGLLLRSTEWCRMLRRMTRVLGLRWWGVPTSSRWA